MTLNIKEPLGFEKIKSLLEDHDEIIFVLTEQEFKRDYVIKLQNCFPNHVVFEIKWMNKLLIALSISTNLILENLVSFYKCVVLFDLTAHKLMSIMAKTYDLNLSNSQEIHDLKTKRSDKQRGEINDEWNYHFHGTGCSFTNKKNKEFLVVQINNGLEYGKLESYSLMRFIQSTDSLKEQSSFLNNNPSIMIKVIQILWEKEYLVTLPNRQNNELIINRNKKPVGNNFYI